MAWEGRLWVKLRRPLKDEEKSRQLKVDILASGKPHDDDSIFGMNDSWLETMNAAYQQRGMLTYGCIFILAMGVMFVWGMVWALSNPPPNTSGAELVVAMAFVVVFMLFGFGVILVSLWGFRQEMFYLETHSHPVQPPDAHGARLPGGWGEGGHFGALGQGVLFH